MTIKIACIGKLKEKFYIDGCEEYRKRLSRFCTVKILESADEKAPEELSAAEEEKVKEKEGERLLASIDPKDRVIALTIGGKRYTSESFATHLEKLENDIRDRRKSRTFKGSTKTCGRDIISFRHDTPSQTRKAGAVGAAFPGLQDQTE